MHLSSPARIARPRNPKPCRRTHASFSMNAPAAARSCGQSRVIAACSVPTARCPVRRSKPNALVRPGRLTAARDSTIMTNDVVQTSRDWLASTRTNLLAWWIPQAAILASLLSPLPARTAIWIIALIWMGTACLLNVRRCSRTHCRYTGPYYLAMIVPTLALGLGVVSIGLYSWLGLACVVLLGSKVIWWVTERAWGTFS